MSESPFFHPIAVPAHLLRRPLPPLPGEEVLEPLEVAPAKSDSSFLPSAVPLSSAASSLANNKTVPAQDNFDSLVKAQVAAALKSSTHLTVPKTNYKGKVASGCTLFLAPPADLSDEFLDTQFGACQGLIGREFRVDKKGRVAFGFFRSPEQAIAAIAKLQVSTPPLYAELGERTVPEGKEIKEIIASISLPFEQAGEPYHTLRISHPNRSVTELNDIFSLASGMEEFHVDSKGIAWVRFANVNAATAALEYFVTIKDDVWVGGSIVYAKKLDSDDDEKNGTGRTSRNYNNDSREKSRDRDKKISPRNRRRSNSRSRGLRTQERSIRGNSTTGKSMRGRNSRREWKPQRRGKSIERSRRRSKSPYRDMKLDTPKSSENGRSKRSRSRSKSSTRSEKDGEDSKVQGTKRDKQDHQSVNEQTVSQEQQDTSDSSDSVEE